MLRSLAIEARAKLIWGDRPSDVRQWLSTRGVTDEQIEVIVRHAMCERARTIRGMGLKDVLIGLPLSLGGTFLCVAAFKHNHADRVGRGMGAVFVAVGYGFFRTLRGAERLIAGARMEGSIPEMDDD